MNWKQAFSLGLLAPGVWGGESAEQWETVYENDSLRSYELSTGAIGANISLVVSDSPVFTEETGVRLTVDGVVVSGSVISSYGDDGYSVHIFGNPALIGTSGYDDNGEDYAIITYFNFWAAGYILYFYSRYEGTYSVKVERKVS